MKTIQVSHPSGRTDSGQTFTALVTFLVLTSSALACGDVNSVKLRPLAHAAVSPDATVSSTAIASLRAQGPAGLEAMLEAHHDLLENHAPASRLACAEGVNATWLRLKAALDAIGQQRDCYASRLYWFTDFEQAKAAAKVSGKPILSLRLLGKLDEEFSCANSRFFRTTLYANVEVSTYLREHFILHWKSVRPVPRLTIDFGDGRKLERTITGNSVHYVLDAEGRLVDALPGLYGPQAFLLGLERADGIARRCSSLAGFERNETLRQYHATRSAAIEAEWASDLEKIKATAPTPSTFGVQTVSFPPPAQVASRVALSKSRIESPILRSAFLAPLLNHDQLDKATDDSRWTKIAALHAASSRLDDSSKALMRSKTPNPMTASRITESKRQIESPLLRALGNLERSIAEDTVRNEYMLHSRIHEWFAKGLPSDDVDKLNSRVYAELFLTPESDPWLGLVPADTCTALENDGLLQSNNRPGDTSTRGLQPTIQP